MKLTNQVKENIDNYFNNHSEEFICIISRKYGLEINTDFYEWLKDKFYKDNIPKYVKYFDEWVINLTENQVNGFYKQMTTILCLK